MHARQKKQLAAQVCELFHASKGRYGSPRIYRDLQALEIKCSQKRVAGLMKEQHLWVRKPRRFVATTDSGHAFPIAPNLLNRQYQVEAVTGLNRVWAGDITYVPTAQCWLYVAVILDLKSRRVIGWRMKDTLEQTLVQEALEMAVGHRLSNGIPQALLFHSDRGSQYAAHDYQGRLETAGIVCSMSRRRNCWDNAVVESFFATLKKEEVHRRYYLTREQAKASLFHYIEVFYNRIRRHSRAPSGQGLPKPTRLRAILAYLIVRISGGSPIFISQKLLSNEVQKYFRSQRDRSAQPHLNSDQLKGTQFGLPPLDEQRAIAGVLRVCDAKIAALEQESTRLGELFRALLEELMSGRLSALPLAEKSQGRPKKERPCC